MKVQMSCFTTDSNCSLQRGIYSWFWSIFITKEKEKHKKNVCIFCSNFQFGISMKWFDLQGLFQYCLGTAITVNDERRDWSTKWIVLLSADTRIWLERLVSSSRPSYRPLPCLHESQGTLQHLYVQVHFNFIHQFHWCLHPLLKLLFFFNFLQKLIVVH